MAWHPPEVVKELNAAWDAADSGDLLTSRGCFRSDATRWVRFHSLPESKRWPDTRAKIECCLARFNAVADAVIPPEAEFFLLTRSWSEGRAPRPRSRDLEAADPTGAFWRSIRSDPDDPGSLHLFASRRRWRAGELDPVIRLTAEDATWGVSLIPPSGGWRLHPYDGGLDVELPTTAARDHLKARFSCWLSSHPKGL